MKPRVSSISVARLCNLGNYEHVRYEVTIDFPPESDVTGTLLAVEGALNVMAERPPSTVYSLNVARDTVKKADAGEEVHEHYREHLPQFRQQIKRHEAWEERQKRARRLLGDLGLSAEFTDHKLKWDEDQ